MQFVEQIESEKQTMGKSIYRSVSDQDITYFKNWFVIRFPQIEMDFATFIEFTKKSDGLNFNGLFVYSLSKKDTHNIYDENEEWWENEDRKKYIFFADDNISWYCFDTENKQYLILDKPGGEMMEQYSQFDEMFACALETAIL
jgi:hypothetical protein